MNNQPVLKVLVAGSYQDSEGYPNVKHKLEILSTDSRYETTFYNRPISLKVNYESLWTRLASLIRIGMGLLVNSISVVFKILVTKNVDIVYIPYPAVHVAWLLGLFPKGMRPHVVVLDAFISIYDTIVEDRKLIPSASLLAKIIFSIERRAFRISALVLTDTPENSKYYSALFTQPSYKFSEIALSIDERAYNIESISYAGMFADRSETNSEFNVLFVGTMVPLHGIDYLIRAIRSLESKLSMDREVNFIFIGNGQEAKLLDSFLAANQNENNNIKVTWIKKWLSSEELSEQIKIADVCLGIFGSAGKSLRVWPYKNYCYLACGKPLITGNTPVSRRLANEIADGAFATVDLTDPESFVSTLMDLLVDDCQRYNLGQRGRQLYVDLLSHEAVADKFYKLFHHSAENNQ